MTPNREALPDRSMRHGPWTIHICEDHGVQDCTLCGVFDVVTVVRADCEWSEMVAYHQERYARRKAEVTHLKEEQVSLVGSLGDAQAEVEKLREAARETLGAIEDRWDGTDKSPLWGLGDALETALETDETEAHRG